MNIALEISYLGKNYSGYQVQPNKVTVQGVLENAIEKAFGKKITTTASGRTDAGVSALCQVVNFNIETSIPAERIMYVIQNQESVFFLNICKKQKGKAEKQELKKAIKRAKAEGLF
jgi:tRNA pseudouridine(38-40) synthase